MVTFKVENLKDMNARLKAFAEFLRLSDVCDDDIFASRLVSCELISNVIIHSGEAAEFTGEILSDRISITVLASGLDGVNLHPALPDVLAESGRGMYIINSVCLGDVERRDGGLRVFIELHK